MRELLDRAVRLRGLQVGRVVDVILAPETEEVLGFEVRCEDQRRRFCRRRRRKNTTAHSTSRLRLRSSAQRSSTSTGGGAEP